MVDDLVFAEVGDLGVLKKKAFHIGKKAEDKSDRIVYNEKKAALFYDGDGKGGAKQIKFALLDKGCSPPWASWGSPPCTAPRRPRTSRRSTTRATPAPSR